MQPGVPEALLHGAGDGAAAGLGGRDRVLHVPALPGSLLRGHPGHLQTKLGKHR